MADGRFALLIASSEFQDSALRPLVSAADVEALANVLGQHDFGDYEVTKLINQPSYAVRRAVEEFYADRHREDLVLFYFSGHGIKNESSELFLATSDTIRKYLASTAVASSFVRELMRTCRAQRQIVFLDCCYAGAFARDLIAKSDEAVNSGEYFNVAGRGQIILTASDDMQYAFEGEEPRALVRMGLGPSLSIFTRMLVNGIQTGEADRDNDGRISAEELCDYVEESMRLEGAIQHPRRWGLDREGQIIVAINPRPVAKPLSADIQDLLRSDKASLRRAAVDELESLLRSGDRGLILAARQALTGLETDDSKKVSAAARGTLELFSKVLTQEAGTVDPNLQIDSDLVKDLRLAGETNCKEGRFGPALDFFERALTHVKRENNAELWAATNIDIGRMHYRMATAIEDGLCDSHLTSAIASYQRALEVYRRQEFPSEWAQATAGLANTLLELADRAITIDRIELIRSAVIGYKNALEVYTHERFPAEWAGVQASLGQALEDQAAEDGDSDPLESLASARIAYQSALQVYTETASARMHHRLNNMVLNVERSIQEVRAKSD